MCWDVVSSREKQAGKSRREYGVGRGGGSSIYWEIVTEKETSKLEQEIAGEA